MFLKASKLVFRGTLLALVTLTLTAVPPVKSQYVYPSTSSYATTYGVYSPQYTVASGYGSCGPMKVTDILDQIYCHHGYFTRFSSTDLAAIKVVLYTLGLVTKFAHIEAVLEYTEQAIYILEELKTELYKSYDTSQLGQYYKGAGYDYQDIQDFLANMTTTLQGFEDIRQGYRPKYGMITWGTFNPDSYAAGYNAKYKRASKVNVNPNPSPSSSSARRSRDAGETAYTGDSTCSYVQVTYCAANTLVVKNLLYRILKTIKSISDGLAVLYDYIKNHDCGVNDDGQGKYALLVTADTFGSLLCAADVLLETAKYEYNIYTGMSGASVYSNTGLYGRAMGGSGSNTYPRYSYGGLRYQRGATLVNATAVPRNMVNYTNPVARGAQVANG